jgi:hypothetical protein
MEPTLKQGQPKEIVVIQELGTSSTEGARKRRKSIVTAMGSNRTEPTSPKSIKSNGIGSRLVVGK